MNTRTARRVISALLIVCTLMSTLSMPIFAETTWSVTDTTRVYIATDSSDVNVFDSHDAALRYANLFSKEYEIEFGSTVPVAFGAEADAQNGDVILKLDSSLNIPDEGFVIKVSSSKAIVSASSVAGLFYGSREVLKQLLEDGTVTAVEESPSVAERTVSLDNGRKYFSVDFIKNLIREMSWVNMNTLVLHFSEEMGLGIESKTYPWLHGRDGSLCTGGSVATDNTVLTYDDVREIVEYATLYNVEIIPSLDSPGHMNYIVKKVNEKAASAAFSFTYNGKTYTLPKGQQIGNYFHYNGQTHIVEGTSNKAYSRGIDISNEVAVAFTKSLLTEYATLFAELGCTQFDIGGDELLGWGTAVVSTSVASRWKQLDHWKTYAQNRAKAEGKSNWSKAVAYDAFLYYMNDLYDLLTDESLGYTRVRMWNDDAIRTKDTGWQGVVQLNNKIEIWYWDYASNNVWTYINNGYKVINLLSDYNYYALTTGYLSDPRTGGFLQAYADQIYNEWNPYVFSPNSTELGNSVNADPGNTSVLGGAFAIWCDKPTLKTESQLMNEVLPLIRANGTKSWNYEANQSLSYKNFTTKMSKIGSCPAVTIPNTDELEALIAEYDVLVASRDSYTAESFESYESIVNDARHCLGLNSFMYSQTQIDSMVTLIKADKANLTKLGTNITQLKMLINAYDESQKDLYTIESWIQYSNAVQAGKNLLADKNYTNQDASVLAYMIMYSQGQLVLESTVAHLRVEGLTSATVQNKVVYQGGQIKITVVTPRSQNVFSVVVLDENGMQIGQGTEQAYNRRKPTLRNFTITINANELGTQSFTLYGVTSYTDPVTGEESFLYTNDPITCTVTVVE